VFFTLIVDSQALNAQILNVPDGQIGSTGNLSIGVGISQPNPNSKIHIYHRQPDVSANSFGTLNFQLEPNGHHGNQRSRVITTQDRAFIDLKKEDGGFGSWIFGSHFNSVKDILAINGRTSQVTVDGKIRSEEVKVEIINGPDYAFEPDYKLRTLKEIKKYISENKHLPEIPSAKEMETNGVDLGDMNMRLLKKIEELTLYQIELLERLEKLEVEKNRIIELEKQIKQLKKNPNN